MPTLYHIPPRIAIEFVHKELETRIKRYRDWKFCGGEMENVRVIHDLVWGPWLLVLFLGTGIFYTFKMRGFQIFHLRYWWKATVGTLGGGGEEAKSQMATACTALAATVGTGNIAGVATAIAAGGPGAVFWMWVSAFVGMAAAYGETYLGIQYRYRGADGQYICGPFVYLERGLKSRKMGLVYAFFCVLASLGMGSMVQANSISDSFTYAFSLPPLITGLAVTLLTMAVIFGGIGRISEAASRLVPFSACLYMVLCGIVIFSCYDRVPGVFAEIVKEAFNVKSAAGGAAGYGMTKALSYGVARGVFSNEAGLGSLAVLHGSAGTTTAGEQGMWAIFEVFFDTIISCTLTALVILCIAGKSGAAGTLFYADGQTDGSAMIAACFSQCFGAAGGYLTAVSMALFAFATIIAWFYLGRQAVAYLTEHSGAGRIFLFFYGFVYLNAVFFGCVAKLQLVWNLSDVFNGLMAVPNLVGILLLSKEVKSPLHNK